LKIFFRVNFDSARSGIKPILKNPELCPIM
jgi:hypothetical protein